MIPAHVAKHHSLWTQEERDDVAEVVKTIVRDDTGISYGIRLTLRSKSVSAYEEGEGQVQVWTRRWEFGPRVGNSVLAREQDALADAIAATIWPDR